MNKETPKIQAALVAAMRDISKTGIAKTSRADLGGGSKINFRGIEAAMNEMSVILIRSGITVTPSYSDLTIIERPKGDPKDAKATRFATVKGCFTFASVEDGSSVSCTVYGEAMDSGDKALTKAQSVAFRTALFQQFIVPTMAMDPEENGDGDEIPEEALAAAEKGIQAYQHFFTSLTVDQKRALQPHHSELKLIAQEADRVPA